jgi:hypothetical protein
MIIILLEMAFVLCFLSDFGANYLFLKLNTNVWKFNYQNIFAELTKFYPRGGDGLLTKKYMAACII